MKVFISWSGELSQKIAKELSEWLPSIIQSIEVFYSPEDIKKGENWDNRITNELKDCKYGIVCLTSENVVAPWIHFEAGALSKALDSRVSTLMVNIVTSEIQGPLSRFQATKFEKNDFYQLLVSINEASDNPIMEKVLQKSFDAIWDKMYQNINKIIGESANKGKNLTQKNKDGNTILEELLQLMRKQDAIISNPEKLLPIEYLEFVNRNLSSYESRKEYIIDIIDSISAELLRIYETNEVNKESMEECYRALIDLAEEARCERSFIRYLQNHYMSMSRSGRRRIKINLDKVDEDKRVKDKKIVVNEDE